MTGYRDKDSLYQNLAWNNLHPVTMTSSFTQDFCQLIETGDQYLADKGFEIHDLIALRGGRLYIPPKRFSATDQFTENRCFETMSIPNVRIHLERAIKRIKTAYI